MNENLQFIQAFLKNPLKVGAIAPSSPDLARQMLDGLKPDKDNIILELGVGTGAITKFVQDIIPDRASYLGIELDPHLVRNLNLKYPDLQFVRGSAADAKAMHEASGLGRVSCIVCCLPFVTLPDEVGHAILQEIEKFMVDGCMLRVFQYAHGYYMPSAIRLRRFMRDRHGFSKRSQLVAKNVPPAYTLTWTAAQ